MTLYDYLLTTDDEVTVFDKDYDIEVYFYKNETPTDDWDRAMNDLAKLLDVLEENDGSVTVNLSGLIESKIDHLDGLFDEADTDDIMDDIELILAGNVSEKWFVKFVDALK